MRFHQFLLTCLCATPLSSLFALELKTTTQKQITGDLKFSRNGTLTIKTHSGRNLRVPFANLDTQSQASVNKHLAKHKGTLANYSWMKGNERSFSQPWPKNVRGKARPEIKRMTKQWKKDHFVYESTNYEFITNAKLDAGLILKCATLFEATFTFNEKLPLNLPGISRTGDRKFRIYLHKTRTDYARAGGPPNSGGVYFPNTEEIHVPLSSVGVIPQGSKFVERGEIDYRTLSHEITHQLMEGVLKAAWFIEGSAEYVSATPYTYPATFQPGSSIKPYYNTVTSVLGRKITFPRLQNFMNLSYGQFSQGGAHSYARALMLTYFFYQMDGDSSAIKNYLKALQKGEKESSAQKHLLKDRSYEDIEVAFSKAWSRHGINVSF